MTKRKKKSVINMFVGVFVQLEIALAGILNRRFFIHNLSIDYLGCNAVFVNVLEILSLVCCGASAITFLMIKAITSDDQEQIQRAFKINHIYQWTTCGLLAIIGSVASLFLPGLLENATGFDWKFLQIVYLYLVTAVVSKLIYVLLTRWYCYKRFPYLKRKISVTYEQIKETRIFAEIRSNIAVMIAMVVFNGTDNIVITGFLGITVAGLYSNYQTIYNQLRTLISKFINGMSMSVADYIHRTQDDVKKEELFYEVQFLCGTVGVICICCFFSLAEPFITIVFGEGLLLDTHVLFIITIMLFANVISTGSAIFRHSMGKYWLDRNYQLIAAAVNLVLSIVLVRIIGLPGILIGTIAGTLVTFQGYLKVIKLEVINSFSKRKWWIDIGVWTGVAIAALLCAQIVLHSIGYSVIGMIYRLIGAIFISVVFLLILCLLSRRNKRSMFFYLNQIKRAVNRMKC